MIPSKLSSRVGTLRVAATAVVEMMWAGTQADARDTDASARKHLEAVRATGTITVDGRLDEPDWERAPLAEDFV